MSVISKDLAGQIAIKLTSKSSEYKEGLYEDFRNLAVLAYRESIPDEVMAMFKKYPDYIETTEGVRLDGNGFSREYVSMIGQLPGTGNFKLSVKWAEKITTAKRKYEDAKKKYGELRRETESALLALKTINNIRKELPAAAPFLPPPISNALVCNFDSLKKKLQKQPEVKAVAELNK